MGHPSGVTIPRWIDIEGVKNFRDLGGWPLKDGSGYIRERIVFRCGHLVNITAKGIRTLQHLNVTTAFDFRSDPEVDREGVMPTIQGIIRVPSAMFTRDDYSPAALAVRWKGYFEGPSGFPSVYKIILEKAGPVYRNIFLHLLHHHSTLSTQSIIVHCTAGKDRTGLFGMLLLGVCGVDSEVIAQEYALTNLGYWEPEEELEAKAKVLNTSLENVRVVTTAPYIAMKQTILMVEEVYGSMEGYLIAECKLTSQEIQGIRDLLVVPIPFEERQLFRPRI
ncbi:protein-tyrosine phosphatase-like protein [Spinellus fusiger]|nr:protein-tyrosine phosphatase-like protein [Spinellus fusiger]